ncbi:unnamed protein product [Arctia plantaginis]|uniref:CCHC-type domain-containing protein n=1 Tax=Arctia plantaginis TaxID=874455 RepID=A0A8S1B524_ARCPL|nr:unnamed protein product [Arctia plantaginis]
MENSKLKRNIKPFNGEKYSVWKFRIRALLSEIDVISVIDEEVPATRSQEWITKNCIAKSTIVEYLEDSYLGFAKEEITAKYIFKNLDAFYERKSLATQLALRKQLLSLKLHGDTPLIKHFTIFEDLIMELLAAGAKLEETDKVSHLLLTLPATYDGVITAIETLSEDNLTHPVFVKTRLLDHEVKLKTESRDTSMKVLQIKNKNEIFKRKRNENTYITNNYPHKNYNHKAKRKIHFLKCHHCGRKGHVKNDCFYFKRVNKSKVSDRSRTVQSVVMTEPTTADEQPRFAFMAGKNEKSIHNDRITFLLDSRVSDHIINRDDFFINYTILLIPIKISVAKVGEFITATKRGTIKVTSDMGIDGVLEDVLFCPEVPYNLLSVSKIQRAGLTIIFDQDGAHIFKDGKTLINERMIRTVTEKARAMLSGAKLEKVFWGEAVLTAVYLINLTPTKALKQSRTPFEMWHNRKPQIKCLRVFGSTVYVHNKTNKNKFDDKSWKGKQLADVLTKPLPSIAFKTHRAKMGLE